MEFPLMLRKVAAVLDLSPEMIEEPTRKRRIVYARYILFLLLEEQGEAPPEIAIRLNKDRTTVIYGLNNARYLLDTNRPFKANYEKCKAACKV